MPGFDSLGEAFIRASIIFSLICLSVLNVILLQWREIFKITKQEGDNMKQVCKMFSILFLALFPIIAGIGINLVTGESPLFTESITAM